MIRLGRCVTCVCLVALLALTGCATWAATQHAIVKVNYPHGYGETLTQSPHEHEQAMANVSARDTRALVEDLDLLFLTDRPTRLTRWHDR